MLDFEETRVFTSNTRKRGNNPLETTIPKYLADLLGLEDGSIITLRFRGGPPKQIIIENRESE